MIDKRAIAFACAAEAAQLMAGRRKVPGDVRSEIAGRAEDENAHRVPSVSKEATAIHPASRVQPWVPERRRRLKRADEVPAVYDQFRARDVGAKIGR
ncbi:hypothetical protein TomTYG75_29810 [Sphingobium sp. TomTYG75]